MTSNAADSCQAQNEYISLIKKCAEAKLVDEGRRVHAQIVRNGLIRLKILGNLLIHMYGRCNSVQEAASVFSLLHARNVFSWITLISAFSHNGHLQLSQQLFNKLPQHNVAAWNSMITAFGQNSQIRNAKVVFDSMPLRETVSWNSLIVGYAKNGNHKESLCLFQRMILEGEAPNRVTFLGIIDACGSLGKIELAKLLHSEISVFGCEFDVFVGTAIVGMYGRCQSPGDARGMFDRMPEKNAVSWTSMIVAYGQNGQLDQAEEIFNSSPVRTIVTWSAMVSAYAQNGQPLIALLVFKLMDLQGFCPSVCTFTSAIDACANAASLRMGEILHSEAATRGFISDVHIGGALVNMYGRCGRAEVAQSVFDKLPEKNEVVLTALICAHARDFPRALVAFRNLDLQGVKPKCITFVSILDACHDPAAGVHFHDRIRHSGFHHNTIVATALACMYRRCNRIQGAIDVFEDLPLKNVVSWTAMMVAYVENSREREALELFKRMTVDGTTPDAVIVTTVFNACANLTALVEGKAIHRAIEDGGNFRLDEVATGLIDMYGKCGSVENAKAVFDQLVNPEMVTWTSMVTAFAQNGHGFEAVKLFKRMELEGVEANEVGIVSVLSGCSRSGMIEEGISYFFSIGRDRGLEVLPEHFACLVDL